MSSQPAADGIEQDTEKDKNISVKEIGVRTQKLSLQSECASEDNERNVLNSNNTGKSDKFNWTEEQRASLQSLAEQYHTTFRHVPLYLQQKLAREMRVPLDKVEQYYENQKKIVMEKRQMEKKSSRRRAPRVDHREDPYDQEDAERTRTESSTSEKGTSEGETSNTPSSTSSRRFFPNDEESRLARRKRIGEPEPTETKKRGKFTWTAQQLASLQTVGEPYHTTFRHVPLYLQQKLSREMGVPVERIEQYYETQHRKVMEKRQMEKKGPRGQAPRVDHREDPYDLEDAERESPTESSAVEKGTSEGETSNTPSSSSSRRFFPNDEESRLARRKRISEPEPTETKKRGKMTWTAQQLESLQSLEEQYHTSNRHVPLYLQQKLSREMGVPVERVEQYYETQQKKVLEKRQLERKQMELSKKDTG